jgi:hypothetical protein
MTKGNEKKIKLYKVIKSVWYVEADVNYMHQ